MTPLLHDLLAHQFWADVAIWDAIGAHPPARDDRILRERLHHVHQVQRFFMWAIGDRAAVPARTSPDDFADFGLLRGYAQAAHGEIRAAIASLGDGRLDETIAMPWFPDPPLTITVAEALTQCAMHSQWHRGQNAARLRELGGEPPTIDLIIWYWKGRPAASLAAD
jgi:uncharacterized damage-inducible protein DinB